MTAATARTEFESYKHDLTDVDSTAFLYWCDYVNKLYYRFVAGVDSERLMTSTTYSVSTSPSTQALPSGFRDMQSYGCGLYKRNADGTDSTNKLYRTGFGVTTEGFYITGTNIVFTGINSSTTVVMRYIPNATIMDGESDTFDIPDEYNKFLMDALDVCYNWWDEEIGAESLSDQRFVRCLDELARCIRKEPDSYTVPDFSNAY